MEKSKLAIIDPVGAKAGMNYYDIGLLSGLYRHKVDVYLFSNTENVPKEIKNYPLFDSFLENKWKKGFGQLVAHLRSFWICKKEKIDWVAVHVFSAQLPFFLFCVLARLFGLKLLAIGHDVDSLAKDDNELLKKWLYKYVSNHIIIHNQYSRKKIAQIVGDKNHYHVIQQGGYLELVNQSITTQYAKQQLEFSDDVTYLLFFGQIKSAKRLDVLLHSMRHVEGKVELVIAGRPWKEDFSKYDKLIKDLSIEGKVKKYIRFVNDQEREYFMKACDIIILPYEEVYQSAALLMAMSYGLAPITSNIDSFKEVIRQKDNGLMFESLNSEDLAQKINLLTTNQLLLEQIKKGALNSIVSEFSWVNIAGQYKKTLNL